MTMSSPTLPDVTSRSFWSRPEGKLGALLLVLLAGAAVYEWSLIVPYIVSMLEDTVHMCILGLELGGLGYLLFSKRMHLFYRVIVRNLTGIFVQLDPIAIIKDKLIQMKKRREKMNEQIGEVQGQITLLKRAIDKNHQDAMQGFGMANEAKRRATSAQDPIEAERMRLQVAAQARKAQRRENANIGYQALLVKLQRVYDFLVKYGVHIDFFIDDTEDTVKQKEIEYKTTKSAFGAVTTAMKVIRGNATEEDIYDQAMEYIEQDVSRRLGIMDDLTRVSQNFMDNMSLEEGAVDEQALKALNEFEQKMLTSGDTELQVMLPTTAVKTAPVPRGTIPTTAGSSDYSDLLK